jgi:hypothetical protein
VDRRIERDDVRDPGREVGASSIGAAAWCRGTITPVKGISQQESTLLLGKLKGRFRIVRKNAHS